jgi:predicted transcriptional regulator
MRTFEQAGQVLGALEERLMELLWGAGAPLCVRDVCERLDEPLAYTTVMTTLDRLFKKGLLARERCGQAFAYRPAMARDDYHQRVVAAAVTPLLQTGGDPVLAAFVDAAADVDEHNLERLEAIIAAARRSRGGGG